MHRGAVASAVDLALYGKTAPEMSGEDVTIHSKLINKKVFSAQNLGVDKRCRFMFFFLKMIAMLHVIVQYDCKFP